MKTWSETTREDVSAEDRQNSKALTEDSETAVTLSELRAQAVQHTEDEFSTNEMIHRSVTCDFNGWEEMVYIICRDDGSLQALERLLRV